jgi:hypothetical protein
MSLPETGSVGPQRISPCCMVAHPFLANWDTPRPAKSGLSSDASAGGEQ